MPRKAIPKPDKSAWQVLAPADGAAPQPSPRLLDQLEKEQPASLGLIMGISCLGQHPPLPKRSFRLLSDKYGNAVEIRPLVGRLKRIWEGASKCHPAPPKDVSYVVTYEAEGIYSHSNLWWKYPMRMGHLVAHALQIVGPTVGDVYYLAFAEPQGSGCCGYFLEVPSRFTPALGARHGWSTARLWKSFSEVAEVAKQLYRVFGDRLLFSKDRWEAKDAETVKGTRLEMALLLYSQSMLFVYQQDTCLRLHIALEALFRSESLGKSTVALACANILRGRVPPRDALHWVLTLSQWRNNFVHGDEPAYQYPNASAHTRKLKEAGCCGTWLLSELFKAILADDRLIELFDKRLPSREFSSQLFDYLTADFPTKIVGRNRYA